jgi:CubicO group peptidase (beta-lactamase class C family)
MNRVAIALVGLTLWLPAFGGSTTAGGRSNNLSGWAAVEQVFHQQIKAAGIVGGSILFVQNGSVAASATDGYQDLATKRPVDADTIFHWASITKTFTGIGIMQLRDRGLLSLDDPIVKFVPEFRAVHNPFGDISQVTIRHMMTHSSGLRAPTWPWGGDKPWHPFEPTQWEQLVAMFPYTELNFAPGTKYSYSNPGVIFLGRIIELLSGDDYEMYITKNILMPIGMHSSFFDRAPYHLLPHRSHSYFRTDGGLEEARFDFDTGITVSNGGLNAPLGDMAKYLAFLTADKPSAIDDAVLKRASLFEMWKTQLPAADGEGATGASAQAGLSFFLERHSGQDFVAHSGDQNGFISHLYIHRPTRSAYVVSFNTDVAPSRATPSRPTTRQVDASVRDAIIDDVIARR